MLFGSGSDRLTESQWKASPAEASLALVQPRDLSLLVRRTSQGGSQMRTVFRLGNLRYSLPLTDSVWEPFIGGLAPGTYSPNDVRMKPENRLLLTVSLGEPTDFDGACYKLVAAII